MSKEVTKVSGKRGQMANTSAPLFQNQQGAGEELDTHQAVHNQQQHFHAILASVVSEAVIPKVYEAHGGDMPSAGDLLSGTDRRTLAEFAALLLSAQHDDIMAYVEHMLQNGTSVRGICLGLFADTARYFGEMWEADELSFAEVTMGLGALHMLVHQVSKRSTDIAQSSSQHTIVLASAPSEQHAFGVLLVSKIFELEGWLVSGGPELHTGDELQALVRKDWFDVIGLTASSEGLAQSLKPDITALRAASLNTDVAIMVGGAGFVDDPSLSDTIGADILAMNADDAVAKANRVVAEAAQRP